MKAREIMTLSPKTGSPNDSAQDVARIMRDNDCGSIPIADEETRKIIGIVTDRDLAIRGLAGGKGAETKVSELMTASPICCQADDDLRDVEQVMVDHQVRRVPIVDANGLCVGIVSQADIALATQGRSQISEREVAVVVERISEPKRPRFDKLSETGLEQTF
ncbi:MAG: CBS domain-containing protein [Gemmatimonadales bacterium]